MTTTNEAWLLFAAAVYDRIAAINRIHRGKHEIPLVLDVCTPGWWRILDEETRQTLRIVLVPSAAAEGQPWEPLPRELAYAHLAKALVELAPSTVRIQRIDGASRLTVGSVTVTVARGQR